MGFLTAFFQNSGLAFSDVLLLGGCFLGGAAYGLFAGRGRVALVAFSLYGSLAVVTNAPVLSLLPRQLFGNAFSGALLLWFLAFFLIIFFVLWRNRFLRGLARERGAVWQAGLMGILDFGLLISAVLFLLPSSFLATGFSPLVHQIFLEDAGRSFWLLAPVVFLCFWGPSSAFSGHFEEEEE